MIWAPVRSIETTKLLNGCTENAAPYVTSPAAFSTRSARMPPGFMSAMTGFWPLAVTTDAVGLLRVGDQVAQRRVPAVGVGGLGDVGWPGSMCPMTSLAIGATSVL